MFTRRHFGKLAAAAIPLASMRAAHIDSRIHGVQLGAQTYSFRDLPLDGCIDGMKQVGLGECELFMGHVEPKGVRGEELKKWRLTTPMDYFSGIRKKFDAAGIQVLAYTLNFKDDFSDEELDRGFLQTKALGTNLITTSTTLTCAKRLAPLAEKHKVKVAMHGHDKTEDANEFATPESFAKAMAMTPQFYINLDIGHFTAGGYDAVPYIEQHHEKILVLHIKDRKKNHGENVIWGQGDTPIKPVLQLLRAKKWAIPCNVEYEYKGADDVTEVRKCFDFCKAALA